MVLSLLCADNSVISGHWTQFEEPLIFYLFLSFVWTKSSLVVAKFQSFI